MIHETERSAPHTDLVPDVGLEILIPRDIDANTPILQPLGLDLVILVRDGRDDDVAHGECVLQGKVGPERGHDVMRVVPRRVRLGR